MRDQDRISSLQYQKNTKQTSDDNEEKYQSCRGLLVDPTPNSPKGHHRNCMENY